MIDKKEFEKNKNQIFEDENNVKNDSILDMSFNPDQEKIDPKTETQSHIIENLDIEISDLFLKKSEILNEILELKSFLN